MPPRCRLGTGEVLAAQSIAQRGVMLVATTHGPSLKALLRNHTLNPLLGGIEMRKGPTHVVTIGDVAARESNSGSKTRLERKDMPTFAAMVEVKPGGRLLVHPDTAESVDLLLPTLTASTTGGIGSSSSSRLLRAAGGAIDQGPPLAPTRALSSADAAAAAGRPEAVRAAHLAGLAAADAGAGGRGGPSGADGGAGSGSSSSSSELLASLVAAAKAGPHTQGTAAGCSPQCRNNFGRLAWRARLG
ncbi:hypothetical protein CHLRE_16g682811v5 [Chlamydomonas reinhardtii]|uniref:Uncharacterized protein n=1 Tax=Chlamydomonas reinhardtii TaxID=3055 RepID=A0A2K3CW07_CHLRE|nr:uncharacterized protein CHLRE_16g682811v5 [Chlamydomonas reinhardtii]PNW72465.1 hypothetical protein CHLRE_16g682811v5 [Chlamydomonas reinhardtii]